MNKYFIIFFSALVLFLSIESNKRQSLKNISRNIASEEEYSIQYTLKAFDSNNQLVGTQTFDDVHADPDSFLTSFKKKHINASQTIMEVSYPTYLKEHVRGYYHYKLQEEVLSSSDIPVQWDFQDRADKGRNLVKISLPANNSSNHSKFDFKKIVETFTDRNFYRYLSFLNSNPIDYHSFDFVKQVTMNPDFYWDILHFLIQASNEADMKKWIGKKEFIAYFLAPLKNWNDHPFTNYLSEQEKEPFKEALVHAQETYLSKLQNIIENKKEKSPFSIEEELLHIRDDWLKSTQLSTFLKSKSADFLSTKQTPPKILYGDDISDQLRDIIRRANKSLDISVSFIRGEETIEAIEQALDNGSKVRIILDGRNLNKGEKEKKMLQEFTKRFHGRNVEVAYLSPSSLKDKFLNWNPIFHRKLVLVNGGKTAVIASDNIDNHKNIDSAAIFTDQQNTALTDIFERDWNLANGLQSSLPTQNLFTHEVIGRGTLHESLRGTIFREIAKTKEKLWLSLFELNDPDILEALIKKKIENPDIDMKVLICWSKLSVWFNGKKREREKHLNTIKKLQSNGISVKIFPSSSRMRLHSRVMLTDDFVVTGSSDYSPRAIDRHLDLTLATPLPRTENEKLSQKFINLWKVADLPKKIDKFEYYSEKLYRLFEQYLSSVYQFQKKTIHSLKDFTAPIKVKERVLDLSSPDIEQLEYNLQKLLNKHRDRFGDETLPLSTIGQSSFEEHLLELDKIEKNLDTLIQKEIDTIAKALRDFALKAQIEIETLPNQSHKSRKILNQVSQILDTYESYQKNKNEYGGAKDFKRYAAFTSLYNESEELIDLINNSNLSIRNSLDQMRTLLKKIAEFITLSFKLSIPTLNMLREAFLNAGNFGGAVDKFFEKWGKSSGIETNITGYRLKKPQSRLRIYVPTHRDANLDAIAFASLKVDKPVIFGALNLKGHPIFGSKDNPLLKPLVKTLERNDSFILAGAAEKPIDKFIRLVKEGKAMNTLIYPEGQVSLGIKETRPVRGNFSQAFLNRLIEEGIDFDLVPVSYTNGARNFQWGNSIEKVKMDTDENALDVKIHKPISSEEVALFREKFGMKKFNTYLRSVWLMSLPTDSKHILGQSRWGTIRSFFGTKDFAPKKPCQQMLNSFLSTTP